MKPKKEKPLFVLKHSDYLKLRGERLSDFLKRYRMISPLEDHTIWYCYERR